MSKILSKPKLKHFAPSEFGAWYPLMNSELLQKLDALREELGSPIHVSPVNGALGRHGGSGDHSQHNVDMWGEVRAIDVFPTLNGEYITTAQQRQTVYDAARKVGFTGIGLYTDTQPGNMLHVDVRTDKTESQPALWSRVGGDYMGIGEVLA
ncbi:hypothetical protein [Saliniradius amylolyticus]|uniref:hypothetical protein n=1 Tax=Saliniradius amylolyticus TaxID=2183582 RepID=UPI0013A5B9BC|nr:hypothetical protein [Saliniradius amylolyticus]